MITDGAYGGCENRKQAEKNEIEQVTTSLAGKDTDTDFAGFAFNEARDAVLCCPQGHATQKVYYEQNGICRALSAGITSKKAAATWQPYVRVFTPLSGLPNRTC